MNIFFAISRGEIVDMLRGIEIHDTLVVYEVTNCHVGTGEMR